MILTGRGGNTEIRGKEWPGFAYGGNGSVPPPTWRGNGVDRDDAAGVPAAFRAVAIAADGVASMCAGVFRGDGLDRVEVSRAWQARFFDDQPNDDESWDSVWSQTEASVTAEGNGYWWLEYDAAMRVASVQVVDPCLIYPKRDGSRKVYVVQTATGHQTVGSDTILHFRGTGAPGCLAAPNPVDVFADALGAAVARQRYETGFYEGGMGQGLALIYPQDMTAAQAREYRDALGPAQGGIANKVRVFGGGPTIQGIGISPRDAQFIEAMNFTVEDVARIYNVSASLLDLGGAKTGSAPISPEHELTRWLRFGLNPRLRRIESAINHHPAFFGAGATLEFQFETDGVLRGDVLTEANILHMQIQDGSRLVDEVRASWGLPPLPNGWGSIPQIVPVGGAPNPNMIPVPMGSVVEPETEPAADLEDRGRHTTERVVLREVETRVERERVERSIDQVTVQVNPTPVEVNVAAPNVRVDAPVQVDVEVPANRTVTFKRDYTGNIVNAEIVEE